MKQDHQTKRDLEDLQSFIDWCKRSMMIDADDVQVTYDNVANLERIRSRLAGYDEPTTYKELLFGLRVARSRDGDLSALFWVEHQLEQLLGLKPGEPLQSEKNQGRKSDRRPTRLPTRTHGQASPKEHCPRHSVQIRNARQKNGKWIREDAGEK